MSILKDSMKILSEHKPPLLFTLFYDGNNCLYLGLYNNAFRVMSTLLSFADYGQGVLLDACVELRKGNDISGYGDVVPVDFVQKKDLVVFGDEAGFYFELANTTALQEFNSVGCEEKFNIIWGGVNE